MLNKVVEQVKLAIANELCGLNQETLEAMMLSGLSEEVGEVQGLYKRKLRRGPRDADGFKREKYIEELGDVLWYLVAVCEVFGIPVEAIVEFNERKLEDRYGSVREK